MLDHRVKTELENAISANNLKQVEVILSKIVMINEKVKEDLGLFLHHKKITVKIARVLLCCGADVTKFNNLRDSPLHSAIANLREPELIEELIISGSCIDSSNRKGNTPLYVALKRKYRNPGVIKILLDYGADINILNRECRVYGNHFSALEYAMYDLASAKLVVKHTLISTFTKDYQKVINLEPFKEHINYTVVSYFLDECLSEITKMKEDMIYNEFSLFDLVITENEKGEVLYKYITCYSNQLFMRLINCNYPIYSDIIISSKIARVSLLNKLQELHMYTKAMDTFKTTVLNADVMSMIMQLLSNVDLLNLLKAFQDFNCNEMDYSQL